MAKIWAHRGSSAYAPENTLEAFSLAAKMHADGVELDVHLTRDGRLAVCHDENIRRTAGVSGLIKDMTLAELKSHNFGLLYPQYKNVTIPTLEEVYELLSGTGMTVNVELKTDRYEYPGIEKACLAAEKACGMQGRVLYSSFHFLSLERIRQLDPHAQTGLLYDRAIANIETVATRLGACALHPKYTLVNADSAKRAKEAGLRIHPWTVDDPVTMKKLIALGVDAIITNAPDRRP